MPHLVRRIVDTREGKEAMYGKEILRVPRNDGNIVNDGQTRNRQILTTLGLFSAGRGYPEKSQFRCQRHARVKLRSVGYHVYRHKSLVLNQPNKPLFKAVALVGVRLSQALYAAIDFQIGTERNHQRVSWLKADPSLESPVGALPGQLTQHIRIENVHCHQSSFCGGPLCRAGRRCPPRARKSRQSWMK